jgi:hypothetical protein
MATGRGQAHDGVEIAVEAASVLGAGALGQVPSSSGDDEGAQQERLHARGEDGIAGFDGVLAIAKLVGETNLPGLGVALLSAVAVGDPDRRAMPAHDLGHHAAAARVLRMT